MTLEVRAKFAEYHATSRANLQEQKMNRHLLNHQNLRRVLVMRHDHTLVVARHFQTSQSAKNAREEENNDSVEKDDLDAGIWSFRSCENHGSCRTRWARSEFSSSFKDKSKSTSLHEMG